jgi:hypothetical protein
MSTLIISGFWSDGRDPVLPNRSSNSKNIRVTPKPPQALQTTHHISGLTTILPNVVRHVHAIEICRGLEFAGARNCRLRSRLRPTPPPPPKTSPPKNERRSSPPPPLIAVAGSVGTWGRTPGRRKAGEESHKHHFIEIQWFSPHPTCLSCKPDLAATGKTPEKNLSPAACDPSDDRRS